MELKIIIADHVTYSRSQALKQVRWLHFKSLNAHLSACAISDKKCALSCDHAGVHRKSHSTRTLSTRGGGA